MLSRIARASFRASAAAAGASSAAPAFAARPALLLGLGLAAWAETERRQTAFCDLRSRALGFSHRFHQENVPAKELFDLHQETHLSNTEIIQLHEAFKHLDTDQLRTPGRISENEFKVLAGEMGLAAPDVAHRLFQVFDQDHSGSIDFKEFVCAISLMCKGTPFEKLKFFFQYADIDGNGYVDVAEMETMLRTLFAFGTKATGQLELRDDSTAEAAAMALRIFAEADLNNDGVLTFDEFYKWASSGYADSRLVFSMFDVFSAEFKEEVMTKA